MNVDGRRLGASWFRVRELAAGLALLAAGCGVLGVGSRLSRKSAMLPGESSALVQAAALGIPESHPSLATVSRHVDAQSLLAQLPLVFEPNLGQANLKPGDPRAQFIARGMGYTLLLGSEGATVSLESTRKAHSFESVRMRLAGASSKPRLLAADPLRGKTNYLLGNDPANWRQGVPQFARVRYESVYPGVDLVFYGNQGRLEYDFQVAPGADPSRPELEFQGAKSLKLQNGALLIEQANGNLRLEAPRVYQEIAGREQPVTGAFVVRGPNRAGFEIGPYDHSRELIIDPVLTFSSYFGGTGDEHFSSIALDGSGNMFLAGSTTSATLPVGVLTGVLQSSRTGVQNVYVAKITPPQGSVPAILQYVTFLGGNGTDVPAGIGVDGAGDAFVAGTTTSTDFPTTATAYQAVSETGNANPHVFVSKLNPAASALLYSSYLSGNDTDTASGMTIDGSGNLYVTGSTTSTDVGSPTGSQFPASSLPYATPFQDTSLAKPQFFVTKVNTFNAGKASIAYSTYFGGAATANNAPPIAVGGGIAVDTNQNIYFSGTTNFTYTNGAIGDFPILNAYQSCLDQGPTAVGTACTNSSSNPDAFVAKLLNPNTNSSTGNQLQWSTYFGGGNNDSSTGIALDTGAANVYIVGTTNSPGITGLTTFAGYQICLDTPVNPTSIANCPTSLPSPPPSDAFVARFNNPTSTTTTVVNVALTYFSYLGGTDNEAGQAITVDSASGALVTGWTRSGDFPVQPTDSNIQTHLAGPQDAFVARLNTAAVTGQNTVASWATYFGGNNTDEGTGIALDVNQNTYIAGDSNSTTALSGLQTTNAGGFDAFVAQLKTASNVSIAGVLTLGTTQGYVSAGDKATFTYTLTNGGPDPATNITVTDDLDPAITVVPLTNVTATATGGNCSGGGTTTTTVVCSVQSLQAGSTATITITATPTASTDGSTKTFNGGSVQVTGPNNIVLAQTSVPAQMSDFRLNVTPPNQSVAVAGDTAVYQVQLTPNPVYVPSIALTCSGAPTGAACSFTTSSVTLQGGPGASTLNLTTTPRPITTGSLMNRMGQFYAALLLPGLAFVGIGSRNRRRARVMGFLLLCILLSQLLLLPSCSKTTTQQPVSGTPAGTYSITVSATAGTDVKSQVIKLTVP